MAFDRVCAMVGAAPQNLGAPNMDLEDKEALRRDDVNVALTRDQNVCGYKDIE